MRSLTRIRMSQESRSSPSIMWSVKPSFTLVTNSLLCWCSRFMRGTRPCRQMCLLPLERARLACSYCMRSQPRCGTPQQAHACNWSFRHWTSLYTVIDCLDTQRIPPPRRARCREARKSVYVWVLVIRP